jgi:sulfite reductase alpha subunit-like flavoprotein
MPSAALSCAAKFGLPVQAPKPPTPAPATPAAKLAPKPGGAHSVSNGAANGAANGPVPAGGGAAVLARLRQQRAASGVSAAKRAAALKKRATVAFLYASQTGTAEEIAHSLFDECGGRDIKASVNSLDDHKFENITAEKTPVLVVIAASTGDGDAPDNARKCTLAMKTAPEGRSLNGVRFTVLGLGDSNYTKFMEVPRLIKRLLLQLGAEEFYACKEADEVDGLEDVVEAWSEALWEPLADAVTPAVRRRASPQRLVHRGAEVEARVWSTLHSDVALGCVHVSGEPADLLFTSAAVPSGCRDAREWQDVHRRRRRAVCGAA